MERENYPKNIMTTFPLVIFAGGGVTGPTFSRRDKGKHSTYEVHC